MRALKFLLGVLLLWWTAHAHAALQVRPDRDPVGLGEEFTLEFIAEGAELANPNTEALEKDFQIVGTGLRTQVQVVNGMASQTTVWQVRLVPKNVGKLTIPALQFGTESSPPTQITVQDAVPDPNAKVDILVELEADSLAPYVQQQVIVTQRLLHAIPLLPTQASMSHPDLVKGKGLIQQLGSARNTVVQRKGVSYQAIERRYAVFPQTSGELELGRTVFEGVLDDRSTRRRDPFGFGGQRVRRFSRPLTLQVKPQASTTSTSATSRWLPAQSLSLNAYWEPASSTLKAGEPATLTLAIMVQGLLAEQLPALELKMPFGIKGYANQPEFRNDLSGANAVGIREEKWVLIGTADGDYLLPEVTLSWWNIKTGTEEIARLPATTLRVTGAGAAPASAPPLDPGEQVKPAKPTEALLDESNPRGIPLVSEERLGLAYWLWGGALLGAVLGLVLWWWQSRAKRVSGAARHSSARSESQQATARRRGSSGSHSGSRSGSSGVLAKTPLQTLQQACVRNDAQAAFQALQAWVREEAHVSPPTLAGLRLRADLPLRQALDELSTVLYASTQHIWEGAELWQAVESYEQQRHAKAAPPVARQELAALYPD